jgi:hypothetical protein
MTGRPRPSPCAHELWFRGIPRDDGRPGHEALPASADGSSYGCLRACWQLRWPVSRNLHRSGPRLVAFPPRRSNAVDRLKQIVRNFRDRRTGLVPGGCPLLNAAIDCDDGNPQLRAKARQALSSWLDRMSPLFLGSAYPSRFSRRGRRRLPQALACSQSAGRFHPFPTRSLA